MITLNNKEYLTVTETLTFLQISKMTLWRWIKDGKIVAYRMSKRKIFFSKELLMGILK